MEVELADPLQRLRTMRTLFVGQDRTAEQATWYRLDDPPWIDDGARISFFTFLP